MVFSSREITYRNVTFRLNEHSSICIRSGEQVVYVDPYQISTAPHDASLVLVTHSHFDHLDPDSLRAVMGGDTCFAAPANTVEELAGAGVPASRIVSVFPGERYEIAGIPVETVAAYNLNKQFHPRENRWVGYVVEIADARIYICGDTDDTPEARAVNCDVVCVPVGGTYTTSAQEAAMLVAGMNPAPKLAIPEHYGTIVGDPDCGKQFAKALAALVGGAVEVKLPY